MNEMNFENIDALIKQAAEKVAQPDFDNEAWDKMNHLLDKEFGEKKRRFIFWWWLLPVIIAGGTATYFISTKHEADTKKTAITIKENIAQPKEENATAQNNKEVLVPQQNENKISNERKQTKTNISSASKSAAFSNSFIHKKISSDQLNIADNKSNKNIADKNLNTEQKSEPAPAVKNKLESASSVNNVNISAKTEPQLDNSKKTEVPVVNDAPQQKTEIKKYDSVKNSDAKKTVSNKTTGKKLSKFFITAGIAADASFIHLNKIEQAKAISGIGFGYSINKRIILQTGFYAGSKIYAAQKKDYSFKNYSFPFVNTIEAINADCYVFDVPLTMRYSLTLHKKFNWFVTAGLSSLFMKNESYNVYYNYGPNTPTHEINWTYSNKNNHPFSVLNLSAGLEAALNKNLFISAEPYYKLPLGGIGEGAVQLSSIGLQIGVRYNFLKKN